MFSRIFKKKPKELPNTGHWKKQEFFGLIADLHLAFKLLSEFTGGYSVCFSSAVELHKALVEKIAKIENGITADFMQIRNWFAPTCHWDDFTG